MAASSSDFVTIDLNGIGDAEGFILTASGLGLSYGKCVAKLVHNAPLDAPSAERRADRAALLASTGRFSALTTYLWDKSGPAFRATRSCAMQTAGQVRDLQV